MTESSSPRQERYKRVEGLPAQYVQASFAWIGAGFALAFVLAVVSVLLPPTTVSTTLRIVAFSTTCVCAVAYMLAILLLRLQREREIQTGYTTLRKGFPDLDMVDPRTGVVLRRAGDPDLTPTQLHERLLEARRTMT